MTATQTPPRPILSEGDTFTHQGQRFRATFPRDEDMREPWKEHDGHGVISDWTTRTKAPGEKILIEDRESRRYYDIAATLTLARKDGWGCSHSRMSDGTFTAGHPTQKAAVACAVEEDYQRMRAWCTDEWSWCGVVVKWIAPDGETTSYRESVWGIEDDQDQYLTDTAYELAEELIARLPGLLEADAARIAARQAAVQGKEGI